jgi:hypothetical protein
MDVPVPLSPSLTEKFFIATDELEIKKFNYHRMKRAEDSLTDN